VAAIDDVLPVWDARHLHDVLVTAPAERGHAALLAVPAAADPVVRALLVLRGLPRRGTVVELFEAMGFETVAASATESVLAARGRPWRADPRIGPLEPAVPGTVAIAAAFRAVGRPGGCRLESETRIAAADDSARRAFLRYWRVAAPFSGLIRARWLRAAARALDAR
jgi:hypothetical protein